MGGLLVIWTHAGKQCMVCDRATATRTVIEMAALGYTHVQHKIRAHVSALNLRQM
jgi:hypothetical protein